MVSILLLLAALFFSVESQAIEITLIDKQLDLSPTRPGNAGLCRHIFRTKMYGSRISTVSTIGFRQSELHFFPENKRDPRTEKSIDDILKSWEESGRYNKDNLHYLRTREENLQDLRTSYIEIRDAEHVTGIRKFDASTHVMNHGQSWFRSSVEQALSPIERIYNYRFPERQNKDSFIWELGLLVAPKHFRGGASAAMANMAFLLDAHYNKIDYRTYGTTDSIAKLDLQIYGVARAELIENYRQYGFEPVWIIDSKGDAQPMQFADGLILIKVSGQRFLELNFDKAQHPDTASGEKAQDMSSLKETMEWLRKTNREARDLEIPNFPSRDNWLFVWDQVMSQHLANAESQLPGSIQRQNAYFDLVRSGFLMLRSPRAEENDPNVEAKRFFFKELLSEGPEAGLALYKEFILENKGHNQSDYAPGFFRIDF